MVEVCVNKKLDWSWLNKLRSYNCVLNDIGSSTYYFSCELL